MLKHMREDSPVSDHKPDTRARLSDNDYDGTVRRGNNQVSAGKIANVA